MPALPKVRYAPAFTLSEAGSDRGSAYPFASKSITLAGKTFVTWTDAIAETQMRVFDHASKTWGPTVTLPPGTDNHNSPSLTVNKEGHLRIAYGPHGGWAQYPDQFCTGAFRYHLGLKPASIEGLDKTHAPVGFLGTYACLAVTNTNRDVFVYRGGQQPPSLLFQIKDDQTRWSQVRELVRQDVPPGYTHYGAQLVTTHQGRMYLTAHTYSSHVGYSLGVIAMRSDDEGETWTDMQGKAVKLPTLFEPRLGVPSCPATQDPRAAGLVVDSRGNVSVLTLARLKPMPAPILSHWNGSSWDAIDLTSQLPANAVVYDGFLSIDSKDRLHIVLTAGSNPDQKIWGQADDEVYHLVSNDKKNFVCNRVSDGNPSLPNWHANITIPSLHNPIETPVILYTQGPDPLRPPTKEGNMSTVHTKVIAVRVESVE